MTASRRQLWSRSLTIAALASLAWTASASAAPGAAEVIENGTATWYGGKHIGRFTSSGEVFSATELTAAHPYLPLGTRVRVTMDDTGSSVVVRINDRQPSHGRRIIDLSREAALQLGMLARGAAPVTVSAVGAEPVEVAMAPDAGPVPPDGSMAIDGTDEPVSAP